jgi:hypothetical protein
MRYGILHSQREQLEDGRLFVRNEGSTTEYLGEDDENPQMAQAHRRYITVV